jgi:Putative archaeal flagellar protein D/E
VTDLDAERPYLSSLPAGLEGETLVLDWMAFLRSRAGIEGARDALAYYRAVGWISGDVEDALTDYVAGVGGSNGDADGGLGTTAHRRSLLFVARLTVARQ